MNNQIQIRRATDYDVSEITSLFRETVLTINSRDYNDEQVNSWSASAFEKDKWLSKINGQHFICAISEKSIIGFASLAKDGYLDLLYVHKNFQRMGIASLLLQHLEMQASVSGLIKIFSDVSITAKTFFEKKGFSVIEEQRKLLGLTEFINYRMEKYIQL